MDMLISAEIISSRSLSQVNSVSCSSGHCKGRKANRERESVCVCVVFEVFDYERMEDAIRFYIHTRAYIYIYLCGEEFKVVFWSS